MRGKYQNRRQRYNKKKTTRSIIRLRNSFQFAKRSTTHLDTGLPKTRNTWTLKQCQKSTWWRICFEKKRKKGGNGLLFFQREQQRQRFHSTTAAGGMNRPGPGKNLFPLGAATQTQPRGHLLLTKRRLSIQWWWWVDRPWEEKRDQGIFEFRGSQLKERGRLFCWHSRSFSVSFRL